ncbi:unnamed protein product [Rhizoctonia solani]|uniref:Uncharacterized protein n=1 Tax=Rhizoctonia solani TaxID=456999 RepID=A0A8H3CDD8_9AGAM|nr:unnamed protein product [Rhizoctonia solani]CAE6480062.1 unnamed protein product [Rhizoctonia solani]
MAQPDYEEIGRCLTSLGGQVPLINNQLAMNQNAQILAAIQGMEGRLVAMEGRLVARIDQTNVRIDQTNVRIDQTNARITELAQTQEINDKKSLARALNSAAVNNQAPLYPLPLPNGDEIPEGQFPDTLGDFRELSGPDVVALLRVYGLAVPNRTTVPQKRSILATHCGIRD